MNLLQARVELRWFYTEREGELGMRASNPEPGTGGPETGEASAERRTRAYTRDCDVLKRLRAIGPGLERVLRVAYAPAPPGFWRGLERWYELAGVAALIANQEDLAAGARAAAALKGEPEADMRKRAKAWHDRALREFSVER